MPRSVIAAAISCSIAMISVVIMIVEGTITPEAWALLLITPIPVAVSITTNHNSVEEESDSLGESGTKITKKKQMAMWAILLMLVSTFLCFD